MQIDLETGRAVVGWLKCDDCYNELLLTTIKVWDYCLTVA